MDRKPKWGIGDILRLEVLVYRHRDAEANGNGWEENASNQLIYRETMRDHAQAADSRSALLYYWTQRKWQAVFANSRAEDCLELVRQIRLVLVAVSFVIGAFAHTVWGSMGDSINALKVLASHAFLPLVIFLCVLLFGRYQASVSAGKGQITKKHTDWILSIYGWLLSKVLRQFNRDPNEPGAGDFKLTADALRDILRNQGRAIRQWLLLGVQSAIVAYFLGFTLVFVFNLLFKSEAFHWGTTVRSFLSAERVHHLTEWVSLPWKHWLSPPTLEMIRATESWKGAGVATERAGWEAWALFLMAAIVVYTVLPRTILCLVQKWQLSLLLGRNDFEELRFDRLVKGMQIITGIETDVPDLSESGWSDERHNGVKEGNWRVGNQSMYLVICDAALVAEWTKEGLQQTLAANLGLNGSYPFEWIILGVEALSSESFKGLVAKTIAPYKAVSKTDRIIHILDAAQPPKGNYKRRLEKIREAAGNQVGVIFALLPGTEAEGEAEYAYLSRRYADWIETLKQWRDSNVEALILEKKERIL